MLFLQCLSLLASCSNFLNSSRNSNRPSLISAPILKKTFYMNKLFSEVVLRFIFSFTMHFFSNNIFTIVIREEMTKICTHPLFKLYRQVLFFCTKQELNYSTGFSENKKKKTFVPLQEFNNKEPITLSQAQSIFYSVSLLLKLFAFRQAQRRNTAIQAAYFQVCFEEL